MKWSKVFQVARREYWVHFRRPFHLFLTFVMPILWWLGIAAIVWWSVEPINYHDWLLKLLSRPIAVVDQAKILKQWKAPGIFVLASDLDQGKEDVLAGRHIALVVIPPDYPESRQVLLYLSSQSFPARPIAWQLTYLLSIYAELNEHYTFTETIQLLAGPKIEETFLSRSSETGGIGSGQTQETSLLWRAAIGIALCIIIAFAFVESTSYLLGSMIQEKESHISEILLTSLSPSELLWGKVLGLGALGHTQIFAWLLYSLLVLVGLNLRQILQHAFKVFYPIIPQMIVVGLVLFPLCYLGYSFLVAGLGVVGVEHNKAHQLGSYVLTALLVIPALFITSFFLNPDGTIPRVLSYFPFTMPTAVILRLTFGYLSWWELGGITTGALLFMLISCQAGVRMFRLGLLPYNKGPSWQEMWQILRNPT